MEGNFALKTGAEGDQPFVVFLEDFLVHPGAVIKPLEVPQGDEFQEVAVALEVFGQEDQMIGSFGYSFRGLVEAAPGGDVNLAPDDGFDPGFQGLLIKIERSEHRSVVRNRQGRHSEFFRPGEQILQAVGAVQEAVLGMQVEMSEIYVFHIRMPKMRLNA